jgi:hypothetical protein
MENFTKPLTLLEDKIAYVPYSTFAKGVVTDCNAIVNTCLDRWDEDKEVNTAVLKLLSTLLNLVESNYQSPEPKTFAPITDIEVSQYVRDGSSLGSAVKEAKDSKANREFGVAAKKAAAAEAKAKKVKAAKIVKAKKAKANKNSRD